MIVVYHICVLSLDWREVFHDYSVVNFPKVEVQEDYVKRLLRLKLLDYYFANPNVDFAKLNFLNRCDLCPHASADHDSDNRYVQLIYTKVPTGEGP